MKSLEIGGGSGIPACRQAGEPTMRKVEDSNLRSPFSEIAFQVRRIKPLCQPSLIFSLDG